MVLSVLVAVLPHIQRLPIWFLPMTAAVIGFRFYAQVHGLRKGHSLVMSLLAIAVLILLVYSQGVGVTREVSVSIMITMTVMKLLEAYQKRDAYLVAMLCYFVIMTRFLYSQDLLLLIYLLASIWVSSHALAVLQFERTAAYFNRKDMMQTANIMCVGIPFAIVFFLFFPRLGSPIWGSPDIFGEGKTGISDTMSPGSIVELFMDDSPAFRVTFEDGNVPDSSQLYWRGPVLWHYDGQTWTRKKSGPRRTISADEGVAVVSYQIEQESTGQHWMFSLDYVVNRFESAFILSDSTMYSPTKINQLKHYELRSVLIDGLHEVLSPTDRDILLSYPSELNPQTQAMMASWQKEGHLSTPQALVEKALRHFNRQGFFYSYTPPPLQGHILDQFLFESKRGFCEHYASTFVLMMRMAGIPARVVTGYQGGVDRGEYLLVKQSDAHAWAEVFYETEPGVGTWHRVDPTAVVSPERVSTGAQSIIEQPRHWHDFEWLRSMREGFDSYRYQWNRWVRDFNLSKQNALFELMGFEHHDGPSIALFMSLMVFALSGLLGLVLWWRGRPRWTPYQKIHRQFMAMMFQQKERPAMERLPSSEIHQLLKVRYPEMAPLLTQFETLYLRGRFAKHEQSDATYIKQLNGLLQKIKSRKSSIKD